MRNPALLAAELSGRPLLMRPEAVAGYARLLGIEAERGGEGRSPFAAFMGRARRLVSGAPTDGKALTAPLAYAPRWLGEPDAIGFGWTLKDGIAVVDICGPLMAQGFGWGDTWYHGYDTLLQAYEEIAADARVLGVFTHYKSPGGVCHAGLPELAKAKREMRAASGGKPMWGFCEASYSASYWVTAQDDYIVASREGGVGSIGAVITHCDMSAGLEADGIVMTPIQFGAKKTDGAFYKPLSETAHADMQAEVDQCGRWFVADVMAGRPTLSEEAILATQAGIFFGDSDVPALSGLAQGLTDAVMTEREAFAALRELISTPRTPAVTAAPASMEKDMKRTDISAAIARAGLTAAQATAINAELDKEADAEAPAADGEGADSQADDTEAEAPAAEPGADAVDEPAASAGAPDGPTVLAILALPEAKGRDNLAKALAGQSGMTVANAKTLLAAAPKASALAVQDPPVAPSGGAPAANGDFAEGKALAAQRKAYRGR